MTDRHHILVVDDDARLRSLLTRYLGEHGYRVSVAENAEEARQQLQSIAFDLMVLDVMMPGEDGLSLTRWLRQSRRVPVLLLTAMGETEDRIAGLEAGADDYLSKPFEPRELLLRVGNILRRSQREENGIPSAADEVALGPYCFDRAKGELRRDGKTVHLSTAEAALLAALAREPGVILSREELSARLGGEVNPRTIDVQVTRLRRKLGDDPRQPRCLQTVRGQGYVLWTD